MTPNFWHIQTNQPLFPNMLWSRPETKQGAGKLLIVGGQAQEFIHVAECFAHAEKAGAGTVRVLMPDSTRKITKMLPNIEYAPSNASGSFAKTALAELLDAAQWADGVLLAGDLGKNSETNLMLESFVASVGGALIITGSALTSITMPAKDLFLRNNTVLTLPFDEIQKFGVALQLETPIISGVSTPDLANILKKLTVTYPQTLIIERTNEIWTAHNGRVAITRPKNPKSNSQLAAEAAVWTIQNPYKLFEAATTAAYY